VMSTIDITPQDDHDVYQCSQPWVGGRLQSDEWALRGRFFCKKSSGVLYGRGSGTPHLMRGNLIAVSI
jgi:hypothetical protein